jgi:hypothetical protein
MPAIACAHQDAIVTKRVCLHLLDVKGTDYKQRFTGDGANFDLVCSHCAQYPLEKEDHLRTVCEHCFNEVQEKGYWDGVIGQPEILARSTTLRFTHQVVELPKRAIGHLLDIQPLNPLTENVWVALTSAGRLVRIDLTNRAVSPMARLPHSKLDLKAPVLVRVSPGGHLAAVVNTFGQYGLVMDLQTGRSTMHLKRDNYHMDVSPFPVDFFEHNEQSLIVHATAWNRLDISDPKTGNLLTPRSPTSYRRGEPRPEHFLDYFHGRLSVSPNQEWIVDNGWCWHPVGVVTAWSLKSWIDDNPWESEDGTSNKALCARDYYWDGPLCWVDHQTLAIWGYGRDDEWLIPAVRIFDVARGQELGWFAGPDVEPEGDRPWFEEPANALEFDTYLFSFSGKHGTSVWDVTTGEQLLHDAAFCPTHYHHGAKRFLTLLPDGVFRVSCLNNG